LESYRLDHPTRLLKYFFGAVPLPNLTLVVVFQGGISPAGYLAFRSHVVLHLLFSTFDIRAMILQAVQTSIRPEIMQIGLSFLHN
jgi:hypothetical protein